MLLCAILFLGNPSTSAFSPTKGYPLAARLLYPAAVQPFISSALSHEDITIDSIVGEGGIANELFSVNTASKSMIDAAKQIATANALTDKNQSSYLHFDAENFTGGLDHLKLMASFIVESLAFDDPELPRLFLGRALHTLQDFYSHSNWIDVKNGSEVCRTLIPPFNSPFDLPPAAPRQAICDDTTFLTSGYYRDKSHFFSGGEPPIADKFYHGGPLDGLTFVLLAGYCGGLNKDFNIPLLSPGSSLHFTAAAAAAATTKEFIRGLKDLIIQKYGASDGEKKFRILLGANIGARITNNNMRSAIDFNITFDGKQFQRVLNLLSLRSADILLPELPLGTTHELKVEGTASESATGLAGYTLDLPPDLEFLSVESDRALGVITPISGKRHGDLFVLKPVAGPAHRYNRYRIRKVSPTLQALAVSSQPPLNILCVEQDVVTSQSILFVPVDSTLTELNISIVGTNTLSVRRPDGSTVQNGENNIVFNLRDQTQDISIGAPVPGRWTILLGAGAPVTVNVTGRGSLLLDRLEFIELAGRGGHEGFLKLSGQPQLGVTNFLRGALSGGFSSAKFEFRKPSGESLGEVPMTPFTESDVKEFLGAHPIPVEPFVLYVSGKDSSGRDFQRVLPQIFAPQTIQISSVDQVTVSPGGTTTVPFRVTNLGQDDSFTVRAFDQLGLVTSLSITNVSLTQGSFVEGTASISATNGTAVGMASTIRLEVRSSSRTNVKNAVTVLCGVFSSGSAEPEPAKLSLEVLGANVLIFWNGPGVLQTTTEILGAWQDVPGAESPYQLPLPSGSRFYRLKQ
jgi:von Willebrand factor A domain-containing protein 7